MHRRFLIVPWLVLAPLAVAQTVPGRYIVELTTDPVAEHVFRLPGRVSLRSAAATAHRARVRTQQQDLRRELEQRQARVLESVDTVANALFVEAPGESEALAIASLAGVKRVVPVRRYRMLVDRAAALQRVTEAWHRLGQEHAGEGMKIAILDSGIAVSHPGFQDSSLVPPEGFPRAGSEADMAFTNGKVIVARSYVDLLPSRDPDPSARDRVGHGTALAMAAAGVSHESPIGLIAGVAPRAYLGNYKVFGTPGFNDSTSDEAILKAIDDAVADGMDVINLSLGTVFAPRLDQDVEVEAIERASRAGVIVVAAAGNSGPGLNTMSSPGTAPSAITVGAITSDRTLAASAQVGDLPPFIALPGNGPTPSQPVIAPVADAAPLDGSGLACSRLPSGRLSGTIALILRGTCTFESKIANVQDAGAVGVLVYAAGDAPDPIYMAVGSATLPAQMIGHADGLAVRELLANEPGAPGTLRFTLGPVPVTPYLMADFSSSGPSVDLAIKPELSAVGVNLYVATQSVDPFGDMYDPSGYLLVNGTSFSTPLVAGAAALVKAARPGLTADQYRSLLINTAAPAHSSAGTDVETQRTGAGVLDVDAAIQSTVAAYPASLSLGSGGPDSQTERTLTLTNVGSTVESFLLSVSPRSDAAPPVLGSSTVELQPGQSADVPLTWQATGLAAGVHDGVLTVQGQTSGATARIPYWYAVTSGVPARVSVLDQITSGRRGSASRNAVLFRVTDAAGLALTGISPEVTVVSGGGAFRGFHSYDYEIPGLFGADLQLGAQGGNNVFRIQAGDVSVDVVITGR